MFIRIIATERSFLRILTIYFRVSTPLKMGLKLAWYHFYNLFSGLQSSKIILFQIILVIPLEGIVNEEDPWIISTFSILFPA